MKAGEHAIHIGTGTGYYTAVIGHLAGGTGRVTGFEFEPELASRAAANLARFPQIRIVAGNNATMPLDPADVIYVNAGASRPADNWLDALKPNGRIVLPLTVSFTTDDGHPMTRGAILLITRQEDHYAARCMSNTLIYPCAGIRDEASEQALGAAFAKGDIAKVTKLYRTDDIAEERCWLRAPGWSLAYE